jgi:hypothetical protein
MSCILGLRSAYICGQVLSFAKGSGFKMRLRIHDLVCKGSGFKRWSLGFSLSVFGWRFRFSSKGHELSVLIREKVFFYCLRGLA